MTDYRDDYEVGYGKPPKNRQFAPGQSGFKGRRKKLPESHAEIIARIRDEKVTVNGQEITKFELAVLQVVNQTIKGGKLRDLKMMMELFDKYAALSKVDLQAQHEADSDAVMVKIGKFMSRQLNIDPLDVVARKRDDVAEAELIMGCPHCGPALHGRWKDPEYKARRKRGRSSGIHKVVIDSRDPKGWEDFVGRGVGQY